MAISVFRLVIYSCARLCCVFALATAVVYTMPADGGIKEEVPARYRARFDRWKAEFLSTEAGRAQWESYANDRSFELTIKVTRERGMGAGTDKFQWDASGRFRGATITLGAELDQGFPDPVYYPVLNSLAEGSGETSLGGSILAATKISHEIGHVNQTREADRDLSCELSKADGDRSRDRAGRAAAAGR